MGINASEIKLAGHLIEEAVDATATAIHASPTASRLLEASGLHMPSIPMPSMPAILGEKVGSLLTPDKIRSFAEDLFGQLEKRPEASYELEDKLQTTGWNQSRKQSIAERAILKLGLRVDSLEDIKDTRALYAELKGAPAARAALTNFENARREFAETTAVYNRVVVGPKFADTVGATSRLVEQTGLLKPRLKIANNLAGAEASYSDFTVNYSTGMFDESAVSLVKASTHELTHLEQNQLQLYLKADQMGIGAQASPEQIQDIATWFKSINLPTSPEAIARGLSVRSGRHLTDEAAERAHATIESMDQIRRMAETYRPNRERLQTLKHLEARASYGSDAHGVALELGHPLTGPALADQLFGSENGSQLFAKYSQNTSAAEKYANLSRKQKDQFSMAVITDLNDALEDADLKMRPYFKAYRASRHEDEAFTNGDLAASFHPQRYILKGSFNINEL